MLLVTIVVSYASDRDLTHESSGMVEKSIHDIEECELLMEVMVTRVVTWNIVGCWVLRLMWWVNVWERGWIEISIDRKDERGIICMYNCC